MTLLCAATAACDLGTGSSNEPSAIVVSPGSLEMNAIGAVDTLSAEVRDGEGRVLDVAVAWSSSDDGTVTVSPAGIVTAVANGDASVTASAANLTRTIAVRVAQRATTLQRESGNAQSGSAGQALGQPLVVRAFDRMNNPAVGVRISFQVSEGGGSVSVEDTTGADGRAQAAWTLGTVAGVTQRARAFVTFTVEAAVEFTATADPGPPAARSIVSGDDQSGPRQSTLLAPIVVRVADAFDNPVAGVSATFEVISGGGSFAPTPVTTDEQGRASSSWTVGDPLGPQTASVTIGSLPALTVDAIVTEVPDAVEILAGDGQSGVVGAALAVDPSVRVLDASDNPIASLDVRFIAPDGAVEHAGGGGPGESAIVRTDASGIATLGAWILGTTPGAYELDVSVPGLADLTLDATAETGPPTVVTRASGDGQRGAANAALPDPLVARVTDSFGNPVAGVTVTFTPAPQSGSVTPAQDVTDASGDASTVWTIGSAAGAQFVTAAIAGASVAFSGGVTGLSGFEIELQYLQALSPSQESAFDEAVARWATAIPGRLTPQAVSLPAGGCGAGSPAISRTIDDLLVLVRVSPIDQAFGTLARAGICVVRPGGGLPVVAQLTVDAADIARIEGEGNLPELLVHELAHALGFGTQWAQRGLLVNPSLPNSRGADTHFPGPHAIAAFDAIGGSTYAAGQKVPVENREGGVGTRDSHWRLSVFENELMTGFLTGSSSPLSRVSIASLEDLGYEVDETAADPFSLGPFPAPPRVGARLAPEWIGDDVLRGPVYEVGDDGRIRRVIGDPPPDGPAQ